MLHPEPAVCTNIATSRNGFYGPSKTTQAVAVRAIFGPVPPELFAVAGNLVTDGFGLTVTVI
jgi:hypothetical protein